MIINVMEHHVQDAYDRLKGSIDGYVDTPAHRDDVIVYALNRLQPRYVVTAAGKAVTEVALDSAQHRTTIDVQVLEALRRVTREPRNQPAARSPG